MKKSELKRIAYKQQIDHLAQAQIQALKILIGEQQPYKLSVDGALAYLDLLKSRLTPELFSEFLQTIQTCHDPGNDVMAVISKICRMFRNYPDLLQRFGMFLPANVNLQVQTAGRFLLKVENDENIPAPIKYENIQKSEPMDWQQKSVSSIAESDCTLDETQDSEEVERQSITSGEIEYNNAILFVSKVKERFESQPEIYNKFLELLESVKKDNTSVQVDLETDVFMEVCDLFQNNHDLIKEFKAFVPHATVNQCESTDDQNDEMISQNEDAESSSDDTEEVKKYSAVNDPSIAPVGKYGSYEEHLFFDKVRKALHHKEVYDNFLRCLMLFNEDVITRSELLKVATSFLGKFPDLLKEFKDILGFKECGNNIEAIPMKIIKYENHRLDPEVALDIDYATGGRNGASYRALPKELKQPLCSGRTSLCKEVLNDTWVSFPSWSEDSTFVTSCKTEFEEMIYRCEDERFELDMAIRANSYTINALENIQKRINKMTPEEKSVFSLDDTLGGSSTVLHHKALHRCYGDKTDELVEGLKRNPVVAVPVILKRLKGKDDEWKEKQKHFNNIWREQIDNYYIKSLDHQGINFKQNDSKSFRSKNLLSEMEMVYAEKKENTGPQSSSPHFLLEFKDMCVFIDAINLICQYLKKLPGILREDRRRIELIARNFIPDFFGFPRATVAVEEAAEEEEEDEEEQQNEALDIDNDNDERSGHTSPSESAVLSKDGEFSDPEESNSVEENEISEDSDKNSFIEDSDIFDKLDVLLPTNLPYVLFLVSKNWYVFFRQFHILCERLSRLLHESNRTDIPSAVKNEADCHEERAEEYKPSYTELISKLSQLLSGSIDYSQFEDEARSLFGIHAFVSFTMDKLVLNIVRQLQQIVGDDICKQCTAFFFQHNKIIANGSYSSPMESLRVENDYLKKVERIMNEEKCFKILWHKKDNTLTIELIEHEDEVVDDPYEVEKWSTYLDSYVRDDFVSEDLLCDAPGSPVILPRNLRRQKKYWKRKVLYVENLWQKRHSPTYLKKNPPFISLKRKAYLQACSIPRKMTQASRAKLDESISVCSEVSTTAESLAELCNTEPIAPPVNISEDTTSDCTKMETNKSYEESIKSNEDIDTLMKIGSSEECIQECNETSNQSEIDIKIDPETLSLKSNSNDKTVMFCPTSENTNDENVLISFTSGVDKLDGATMDSNDGSICIDNPDENIDTVAAFHDIIEEATVHVLDIKDEIIPDTSEVITILDSGDEVMAVVSDTESVDKKEKIEILDVETVESKPPPKKEKPVRKSEYSTRQRKNRNQEYVRKRTKRNTTRSQRDKKEKQSPKQEEFDFTTFDYDYFSELEEDDKCSFLAMKDLTVIDDTEGMFKKDSFKMIFVQNCDTFIYRLNCLTRAREVHQQISEMKTSNFNAWHRIWLDRYVTPTMLKFCNDWLMKSDPEKFKLVCITMSDCIKPPYIPFTKYRVRYYKTDS